MIDYWKLTNRTLLFFGLFPMLAGAALGWIGWSWKRDSAAFVANLQVTEGRIVRFAPDGGELEIDVEYVDGAGVPYTKRFRTPAGQEAKLRAIGKVSLAYDARDPRTAELGHVVSANNAMLADWAVVIAGGVGILGGLGRIGWRAKEVAGIAWLFRHGQAVQTQVRDTALAPGKAAGRFTYAFRGPNGRWFEGKSPELPAAALAEWPVGRTFRAAYDPRDPRRTAADIFGVMENMRRDLSPAA